LAASHAASSVLAEAGGCHSILESMVSAAAALARDSVPKTTAAKSKAALRMPAHARRTIVTVPS
jgi:hypothetical protein